MNKENLLIESANDYLNSSEIKDNTSEKDNIKTSEITLDKKLSVKIGKEMGKYITMFFNLNKCSVEKLINELSKNIKLLLKELNIKKNDNILFVGLGNKDITSDSLGYNVIEKIDISACRYKIYKQVEGITNINTFEFIRNLVNMLDIKLVVIIDSLKAQNLIRLNKTIQLTTGGISPGSAFKKSKIICKRNIKANVLIIGIPTIIDLNNIVENKNLENTLVSTKDIDIEIDNLSDILSISINKIF